jgi:uncharacterized protein (TIGR03437 family)
VPGVLVASLDTGSLAGTRFPVWFSYDASQVAPQGESYVTLESFQFTLGGVMFTRSDIFQGGQAIFRDGQLLDVTASFQVRLPPNSPVRNITFGFGGNGVIGYIDLDGRFGSGSFVFSGAAQAVNAASYGAALAPGGLGAIFGQGLSLSTVAADLSSLPLSLDTVSVTAGGIPAPLFYVSPGQVGFQAPWNLPVGAADIVVTAFGIALPPVRTTIALAAPAIFNSGGQAFAVNLDGTLATASHPARPGDYLVIFATGLGAVMPAIADGAAAPDGLRNTAVVPQVLIGGIPAPVSFSGLSPQFAGVNQINAIVPAGVAGTVQVQIVSGGVISPADVTIAVAR